MSSNPCRFGYDCRRADCWFLHPSGRAIDHQALQPSLFMPAMAAMVPQPAYPGGVTKPLGAAGEPDAAARGGSSVCRYGRACHRAECWFRHPDGRTIDDQPQQQQADDKAPVDDYDDALDEFEGRDKFTALDDAELAARAEEFDCPCCGGDPEHCATPACRAAGLCACQADRIPEAADATNGLDAAGDSWRDEWFPTSRECECCEGYVYRCGRKSKVCSETGTCECKAAASDAKAT